MTFMCPTFPKPPANAGRTRERGFAAIAVIFALVLMAVLATTVVTMFSAQQRSSAADALGIQAFHAARAGLDVGAFNAISGACGAANFTIGAFSVNVTCAATSHTDGGAVNAVTVFQIQATACNRGACPAAANETYVERQLRSTVIGGPL